MMMKRMVLTATALLAFGPTVWAGGDKTTLPLVDSSSQNGGLNGFTNGVSLGSVKSAGCTISVGIKGLTGVVDGGRVRCLLDADTKVNTFPNGIGNTLVMSAAAAGGSVKMKLSVASVGCGTTTSGKTITWNSKATCYLPDPGYDPATACNAVSGMVFLPAPPTASPNFEGVCTGITLDGSTLGQRLPGPSLGVIAESGATIPVGAK